MKVLRAVFELYCDYRQSDTLRPSAYYNTLPYMYRLYSALNSDSSVKTFIVSGEGREDDSRNRSHFYVNDLR